jgi:hypothetical protein
MPYTDPTAPVAGAAPAAPFPPQPRVDPRTYPRLLYQYSDEYPGFIYLKVESAEQEAAVLAGDQTAIAQAKQSQQRPPDGKPPAEAAPPDKGENPIIDDKGWYDTPDEARYARAKARLPYEEFGRDIGAPILWPPGTTEAMKATAAAAAAPPAGRSEEPYVKYPSLKYQAIEEPPGFKYVKLMSEDDESALAGSGSGSWYDTPAEAIANPPAPTAKTAGQRPTQTAMDSQKGPNVPEGAGGPSVPPAKTGGAHDDPHPKPGDDPHAKPGNGGKNGGKK